MAAMVVAAALPAQRGDRDASSSDAAWQQLSRKFDADKDGKIVADEFDRGERAFSNLDRNRDGALTAADFAGRRRDRGQSRMMLGRLARSADSDEDGTITEQEWESFVAGLDADEKGIISADKLVELMPARRGRRGGGGRAGRGGRRPGNMAEMIVRMLDRNDNDQLEATDLQEVFLELDADQDKQLGGDELGRGQRGRGNRRGGRGDRPQAPEIGDPAPDFDLPFARSPEDLENTVRLSSYAGKKPVALIFGSYT